MALRVSPIRLAPASTAASAATTNHRTLILSLYRSTLRLARLYDQYPGLKSILENPNRSLPTTNSNGSASIFPPKVLQTISKLFNNNAKQQYYVPKPEHVTSLDEHLGSTSASTASQFQQHSLQQLLRHQFKKYRNTPLPKTAPLLSDTFFALRYLNDNLTYATKRGFKHRWVVGNYNVIGLQQLHNEMQHTAIERQHWYAPVPVYCDFSYSHQQHPSQGKFLLSHPKIESTNDTAGVAGSVILVSNYDSQRGAEGIIINSVSDISLTAVSRDLDPRSTLGSVFEQSPLMYGGVSAGTKVLHTYEQYSYCSKLIIPSLTTRHNGTDIVLPAVYLVEDTAEFSAKLQHDLANRHLSHYDASRVMVYASHYTWSAGQLEQEIQQGKFVVMDGNATHVMLDTRGGRLAPAPTAETHPMPIFGDDATNGVTTPRSNPITDSVQWVQSAMQRGSSTNAKQPADSESTYVPWRRLPVSGVWPLAWFNHSVEGRHFALSPLMKNPSAPRQPLKTTIPNTSRQLKV